MVNLTDCNIQQAESSVYFPYTLGKWYCSMHGEYRGRQVLRYLGLNSTWNQNTYWFDTKEQILNLLARAQPPDFTMSRQEMDDYEMMQQDMARDLFDDYASFNDPIKRR